MKNNVMISKYAIKGYNMDTVDTFHIYHSLLEFGDILKDDVASYDTVFIDSDTLPLKYDTEKLLSEIMNANVLMFSKFIYITDKANYEDIQKSIRRIIKSTEIEVVAEYVSKLDTNYVMSIVTGNTKDDRQYIEIEKKKRLDQYIDEHKKLVNQDIKGAIVDISSMKQSMRDVQDSRMMILVNVCSSDTALIAAEYIIHRAKVDRIFTYEFDELEYLQDALDNYVKKADISKVDKVSDILTSSSNIVVYTGKKFDIKNVINLCNNVARFTLQINYIDESNVTEYVGAKVLYTAITPNKQNILKLIKMINSRLCLDTVWNIALLYKGTRESYDIYSPLVAEECITNYTRKETTLNFTVIDVEGGSDDSSK